MIRNPPRPNMQKVGFSCRKWKLLQKKMHFSTQNGVFLQKNALSYREMCLPCRRTHFSAAKCSFRGGCHMAGNCRRLRVLSATFF